MDIYENIVIGNFLFGFGAELARRTVDGSFPPTVVGNFQQIPALDKAFGDVMIENPGTFKLLEFKRKANFRGKMKELGKLRNIENGLNWPQWTPSEASRLTDVSREIHWFVESPAEAQLVNMVRVTPYLDLEKSEDHNWIGLADLIRQIVGESHGQKRTKKKMEYYKQYLTLLCACRGSKSSALVIFISDAGKLICEPLEDIWDMLRPIDDVNSRREEQRVAIEIAERRQQLMSHSLLEDFRNEQGKQQGIENSINRSHGYRF
jgi:hypothetical protein